MKITTQIIKDLNPCEDRLDNFMEHYPDFDGDHEDFLLLDKITHNDKIWVILRLMERIDIEVFAIDCVVSASAAAAAAAASAAAAAAAAAYAAAASAYAAAAAAAAAYAYAYVYDASTAYAASAAAASAAASAAEKERQLDAICYLINKSELNEN